MIDLPSRIARGDAEPPPDLLAALGDPPPHARPPDPDRIAGALLALAIGDALGNTTESRLPHERRAQHGEIRDYLPNRRANGRRVGLPSDDTQLAFWTLEHVLEHGRVVPDRLAATFADGRRIFGLGRTVRAFLERYEEGAAWHEAAQRSAGNGAVMRIAPVIVPHLERPTTALWRDAILAGAVTHNDASSIAACVAVTGLVWDALAMSRPPEPRWWLDRYVALARPIEGDAELEPRGGTIAGSFRGPIWRLVETEVASALDADLDVRTAGQRWYSGAFLLETMPTVLHILARHADDPEEAIVRAVNDTRDNDTIAAIVGAVVGALHGRAALPRRWADGLVGRTRESDDGRVCELIDRALAHVEAGKQPTISSRPRSGE
ncbi:MAG: ADP-ribosylglycohydrolase [Deltaproteobacteria bacterium]|nr:ADP-ribosylglycohydrolase [Deltaproteobacteria bacterium]